MVVTEILMLVQMAKIDKISLQLSKLKRELPFVFCTKSKDRMKWKIKRLEYELRVEQQVFVETCDGYVMDQELENFLKNQIPIHP